MSRHIIVQVATVSLVACIASPNVRAQTQTPGMGAYAPLTDALAAEPTRKAELDFVRSCRSRLMGLIDTEPSTDDRLAYFDKNFAESKVAQETRLCLLLMLANKGPRLSAAESDRAAGLYKNMHFKDSALGCIQVYARTVLARNRPGRESEVSMKQWLMKCLMPEFEADWLKKNSELEMILYSPFTLETVEPWRPGDDRKTMQSFISKLEALPEERRSFAMNRSIGLHYIHEAWAERGNGWASATSRKQFEGFERNLKKAVPFTAKAREMNPTDTRPLFDLMILSMASPEIAGGAVDDWMTLARKLDPKSSENYDWYASTSLSRWGGSPKNTLDAYEELIRCGEYDGYKAGAAFDMMRFLMQDLSGSSLKRMQMKLAKEFVPVANEYIRRYNDTGRALIDANGRVFDFRAMALGTLVDADMIKDKDQVLGYTRPGFPEDSDESVNPYVHYQCIHSFSESLATFESKDDTLIDLLRNRAEVRTALSDHSATEDTFGTARTSDAEKDIINHSDARWLAVRSKQLETAAALMKFAATKELLGGKIEINRIEQAFVEGKPVAIPFKENLWDLNFWQGELFNEKALGDSGRISPNIHHLSTGMSGTHYATFSGVFKPPYEITLNIDAKRFTYWPFVGISVGRCMSGTDGRSFVLECGTGKVYAASPYGGGLSKAKTQPNPGKKTDRTNTLKIRVFRGGYAFTLNDRPWSRWKDDTFNPYLISVGSLPGTPVYGQFEYGALTVRKIPAGEITEEESQWTEASVKRKK